MIRLDDGRAIPSILYYHRVAPDVLPPVGVTPEIFRAQMLFLKSNGLRGITLDEGLKGDCSSKKSCILTFDDGYLDNFEHAVPILEEMGFRATIFCVSDRLGTLTEWSDDPLWKGIPLMAKEEVRELASRGFEIGSHTRTHCDLGRLSDADPLQARREIFDSRTELEDLLGVPVTSFCYPYGGWTETAVQWVREAGYLQARSICHARWGKKYDPFLLPCRPISGKMPFWRFAWYARLWSLGL